MVVCPFLRSGTSTFQNSIQSRRTPRLFTGLTSRMGATESRRSNHIRDENVLSTSPPLLLHTGKEIVAGFGPGYRCMPSGLPHETVEDRRRNLLGIVQGVFQIEVMFDTILGDVKTPVRLYSFAPMQPRMIFRFIFRLVSAPDRSRPLAGAARRRTAPNISR